MNRTLVALLAATAAGVASANAADMPVKAPPPPIPVYNWSGCYIGGHAGGAWARTEWNNRINDFGDLFPAFDHDDSGFIGGGQLGCNYQTGPWVLGIEGTISGTSLKKEVAFVDVVTNDDPVFKTEIDVIATVTGRLGYAWNNWLLYGKGGYAGANVDFSVSDPVNSIVDSRSDWHNGWTVGVGLEYGWTPNWIIGVEYDFLEFERRNHDFFNGDSHLDFDGKLRINQVVARLSYKFW